MTQVLGQSVCRTTTTRFRTGRTRHSNEEEQWPCERLRFPVSMQDVFAHGCNLMPDSITEAQDYDEKTKRRTPAVDKLTGKRVLQCRVVDMDPDLAGRSRETVVKILADREPVPPTRRPVRAGGVRGPDRHPVRDRQGPDGLLAARDRNQGRPPGRQGRRVMPVRRVTTVTVPVDGAVRCGVRGLPVPDAAADDHAARPACWSP